MKNTLKLFNGFTQVRFFTGQLNPDSMLVRRMRFYFIHIQVLQNWKTLIMNFLDLSSINLIN